MAVTVNYTQEELDALIDKLNIKYNSLVCKLAKKNIYKVGFCDIPLLKELVFTPGF